MQRTFSFLLLAASFFCIDPAAHSQCPYYTGVMVDACNGTGNEGDNEFMLLKNGNQSLLPTDLTLYYSTSNPPSGTFSGTIMFGGSGFANAYTPAEVTTLNNFNTAAATAGCAASPGLFATSLTGGIPPGALILVIQQALTVNYDFSHLCNQAPVYVLFQHNNNVGFSSTSYGAGFNPGGNGRFKNYGTSSAANNRYFSITSPTYAACSEASSVRAYDYTLLPAYMGSRDGGTVAWTQTGAATYANTGCTAPAILPVTLTSFNASRTAAGLSVTWTAADVADITTFTIEASSDATSFEEIGDVPAAKYQTAYYYRTEAALAAVRYLRLKAEYKNGSSSYSAILSLPDGQQQDAYSIYPNPGRESVIISIYSEAEKNVMLSVTDISGRMMMTEPLNVKTGSNLFTIDSRKWHTGSYFITIRYPQRSQAFLWLKQ